MRGNIRRERFTVRWQTRPSKEIDGGHTTDFSQPPVIHDQEVLIEVDMEALARQLGTKACRSKGGRAVAANGLVKVTAIKGTLRSGVK